MEANRTEKFKQHIYNMEWNYRKLYKPITKVYATFTFNFFFGGGGGEDTKSIAWKLRLGAEEVWRGCDCLLDTLMCSEAA